MWSSSSFHIFFEDTKHPRLDAPSSPFRARVFGPDRLEILDEHARSITEHLDTSTGVARLSLVRTLWHTRYVGPAACVAPGLLALGLVYIFLLAGQGRGDVEQSYADVIAWDFVAAMAVAAAATTIQRCRAVPPQLQHQIRRFREVLTQGNPRPEPCAKGPGRAIQAGTLLDFFGHFQGFIRDRAMYYVVSNIVFPLTLPSKLSFAELAGPGELDWFVSHFWGHRFQELCASIQKHAQISGSGKTWRDARYWICSFSNNQHRVAEELGTDWSNSSFYLALLGAGRRGTCLVVDEQALPLTRSWCLFEVAQTVELDKKSLTGEGHLMFCTASGVVNEGSASAEVSLGLAKRLATLRLQDASASNPKDQAMIEEFVKSDMGGFGKMNKCVRDRIALALDRAKDVVLGDFETLQATLKQSVEEEGSRVAL